MKSACFYRINSGHSRIFAISLQFCGLLLISLVGFSTLRAQQLPQQQPSSSPMQTEAPHQHSIAPPTPLRDLVQEAERTLTGIVSDSMCGAHHMAKDKSPAECTRMCIKQGMKYALVVGSKVYTLEGHESEVDKLAGQKATVKGSVTGETVTMHSVVPAKG